jgi:stage II sporulation protein D
MTIGGQETYYNGSKSVKINGRVFRESILEYNIRSASFDIVYDASTDNFVITTYGYGHCVGMSQHGANILATQYGYNYEQILQFFYQGASIY